VTVDPLTVADRLVGADGASRRAPEAGRNRDVVTRAAGHPDEPNVPAVPAARAKHDHETEDAPIAAPIVPGACTTLMPVDGAAGDRLGPLPHAERKNSAAMIGAPTSHRPRIGPSVCRQAAETRRS
jgi:hypothetical protein